MLSGPHEDAAKEITARLRRERDLARQERDLLSQSAGLLRQGKSIEVPVHRRGEGRVGDADIPPVQTAAGQDVSGFYAWRNRGPSQRDSSMTWFDSPMSGQPHSAQPIESYGAERVHHELGENGIEVGRP